MSGNSNLHDSSRNKQDEFYTDKGLIEEELKHYKQHFKGKTVFCNCDDPYESHFFKYFAANFNYLGLKKLIATCYVQSPIAGEEFEYYIDADNQFFFVPLNGAKPYTNKQPYRVEITTVDDFNCDGRKDIADVAYLMRNDRNVMTVLHGDEGWPDKGGTYAPGDFRSAECVKLLKEADIVVTNPPFSLFREYVAQLVEYGKQFLIIGNQNAITYKEIFPLIMENNIWLGYNSGHYWFKVPSSYENKKTDFKIDETGQKWRRMGNICWFTNLDITKRHETMELFKEYSPEKYPKYDNYDAIEVPKTVDIPCDYSGVMGVPITFVSKYNPEQFEILGTSRYHDGQNVADDINFINGKGLYTRILIKRKQASE